MSGMTSLPELIKAAYAEGVKTALIDHGYDENMAHYESEKLARDYPTVAVNVGGDAPREGILSRTIPAAGLGAGIGLLGAAGIGAARSPAWRKQLMQVIRRKKDGGLLQAIKEMSGDTASIQRLAIPGAIGGGAVGLMSGE